MVPLLQVLKMPQFFGRKIRVGQMSYNPLHSSFPLQGTCLVAPFVETRPFLGLRTNQKIHSDSQKLRKEGVSCPTSMFIHWTRNLVSDASNENHGKIPFRKVNVKKLKFEHLTSGLRAMIGAHDPSTSPWLKEKP